VRTVSTLHGPDEGRRALEAVGTEAYFTMNPGGTSKKYLKAEDADNWVFKEEADVLAAMAAHETKMDNLKSSSPAK